MEKLMKNPVIFLLLNALLYGFYGLLIGLALAPSLLLLALAYGQTALWSTLPRILLLALSAGVGVYLFFIMGLLVLGTAERILSAGFRPGKYRVGSPFFVRWLVYSGVHTIALGLVLPFVLGSGFIRLYYRLIGCKLGSNVFINTVGLHDAYLLELGDNVVVGGKSDLTCHIFQGEYLYLGRIKVGDDVMIGANCYIMPGVTIESHCDIGAGSLVRKDKVVEARTVLMPLPALPLRQTAGLLRLARQDNKTKAREHASGR